MQRAAEISAQIFTARNLILGGALEDLRVGFLLFDSAIETLMVRKINELPRWQLTSQIPSSIPPERQVKPDLSDFTQIQSEKALRAKDEYIHWSFSKNQIAKVRMDFSEKLRFLAWRGNIPSVYVKAASRLHEYRNEMYHREEVRPEALRIVAHLYASITADFLDLLKSQSFSWTGDSEATRTRIYERMEEEPPTLADGRYDSSEHLQTLMARTLRRDLLLEGTPQLIADYMANRVERMHELVEHSRGCLTLLGRTNISEMETIRIACSSFNSSSRQLKIPSQADLKRWDSLAAEARECSNALTAFQSLADFEAEFELFERVLQKFAAEVEEEAEMQNDLKRGRISPGFTDLVRDLARERA
jgi:hypothetical protein